MKISIGRRVARGFGAALLIELLFVVPAYRSIHQYIDLGAQVRHSRDLLSHLDDVFLRVQAAESGQRGYLLTGRLAYLKPYDDALAALNADVSQLAALIDGPQQPDFDRLRQAIARKTAELAHTLLLRDQIGVAAAVEEVMTDRGQDDMNVIRAAVGRMRTREEDQLRQRREASLTASRHSLLTLEWGALGITVLLVAVGFWVTRSITRPLANLLRDVQRLGDGVAHRPPFLARYDELAVLSAAFSDASTKLQTAHEALEARVRERTAAVAELQVLNRELEAFTYSVSHDLRSPLRGIDGFAAALEEDCGQAIPPEGHTHLKRIRAAAQRMGQLIDDLLNLSRLGRTELRRSPIQLEDLARSVASEIQIQEPARPVELVVHPMPTAEGDPQLMRVVLDNLLRNAWKFTRAVGSPRIELGWEPAAGERPASYFVRDNGAGFNMDHASKLFQPFQRLHRVTEFPGTGIGLATVARIVHRHHGDVWAQGQVNQGATFHFSLPAAVHSGGRNA